MESERRVVDIDKELTPGQPVVDERDRITCTFQFYHQHCCDEPLSISSSFEAFPDNQEDPFKRRMKVGNTPTLLSKGHWLTATGMLIVQNSTGKRQAVIPSQEQLDEIQQRVVEVIREGEVISIVRPGRFVLLEPPSVDNLYLRCRNGEAEVVITILPS